MWAVLVDPWQEMEENIAEFGSRSQACLIEFLRQASYFFDFGSHELVLLISVITHNADAVY